MEIKLTLPTVLTLVAAVLKLTGVVTWSWLLVLAPWMAEFVFTAAAVAAIAAYAKRNGVTLDDVKAYQSVAGKSDRR
jgi:hypothetical protein